MNARPATRRRYFVQFHHDATDGIQFRGWLILGPYSRYQAKKKLSRLHRMGKAGNVVRGDVL